MGPWPGAIPGHGCGFGMRLGSALPGKFGVLGLEGGQLELPQMVLEQHLGRVAHAAVPDMRLR
jgi:hypothetical protein